MDELLVQWGALAGFAALIAFAINVLKTLGVVKEGEAPTYSAGLNLAGLVMLLVLKIYKPEVDVGELDVQVAQAVEVGVVVFGYVVQLLGSKLAHEVVRGVPGIGKSIS